MNEISNYKSIMGFTPVRIEVVWKYDTVKDNEILLYMTVFKKEEEKIHKNGFRYFEKTLDRTCLRLNSLASMIWELCDAVSSIDDIISQVSHRYPQINREEIEKDVLSLLRTLNKRKCINMNWKPW